MRELDSALCAGFGDGPLRGIERTTHYGGLGERTMQGFGEGSLCEHGDCPQSGGATVRGFPTTHGVDSGEGPL